MTKTKNISLLFLFLILFSFSITAQELKEDRIEIETSIVLLTLFDTTREQIYQKDDFFEIFNFTEKDYILLPSNLISPYLEVELNFNRDLSLLTLNKDQREIRVDLQNKKYLDHPEWDDKTPVIYGGEFYLAKEVFSYLTDYQISWNNSLQEVLVEGKFITEIETETDISEIEEEIIRYTEEEREILGSEKADFILSSVHYRVQLNLEENFLGGTNKNLKGDLNFYGRTGDWAYYINNDLKYNIENSDFTYELDRIKFKYQENNMLIIAGDHNIMFEETIGRNEMQGIYFSLPDRLSYKLIPYTSVKVAAVRGEELALYLNGSLVKKQEIRRDGEISFDNIELRSRYLNKIEVVKTGTNGEEERQIRYIAGSKDILSPGVKEVELMGGRYKDENYSGEGWEGYFGALRSSYAITSDISARTETAIYNESESTTSSLEGEILSSITGISFRVADRAVINLDWLIAGKFDSLESGAQAKFLYSLLNGYVEGIYLYIPPETAAYMRKNEGEDISLSFRLDLNNNISINPTVGRQNTLDPEKVYESDYYIFRLIYNPDWRNYHSIALSYRDTKSVYAFPYLDTATLINQLGEASRTGIALTNNIYGNSFRIASELAYYQNQENPLVYQNLLRKNDYQDYEAEIGLYKRVNNNLLFSLNYDGQQRRDSGGLIHYDREYDGQIRLSFADRAALSLESRRREEESENRFDEETKLRLNYYFNREFSLTGELKDYQSEFLPDYQSVSLSGNYYHPDNPGYIRLKGEYIIPAEGETGYSISAAYDIVRDDESEIKIEIGRNYADFINNSYENYATISYSHAISFIGSEQRKSRFTDFEPRPVVAGYAYLDENYNGIMDPGEKRLANIPMRLGSMMAVTDEDGFFIFKPYFNDIYFLNFDYRNLIADYTPVTEEILVKVKDNQNIMQNFGLTINGTVSGRVFIDRNANGIKDENEEYLMWAGLELEGLKRKDYTDPRGEFYFQNVPLGHHELVLLKDSLPKGTRPLNGYTHDIFITEDQLDHHNIEIPIVYGD